MMLRILLVDDENLVLETLKGYTDWHSLGLEVAGTAMNGQDALRLINELEPDIVLTDVKMPIMDGITLARKARALLPKLKFIFISGYDEFDLVRQAVQVEANAYLLKPIVEEELMEVLEKVRTKCLEEQVYAHALTVLEEKYLGGLLTEEDDAKKARLVSSLGDIDHALMTSEYFLFYISTDSFLLTAENRKLHAEVLETMVFEQLTSAFRQGGTRNYLFNLHGGNFCWLEAFAGILPAAGETEAKAGRIRQQLLQACSLQVTICSDGKPHSLDALSQVLSASAYCSGKRFFEGYGCFFRTDAAAPEGSDKAVRLKAFSESLLSSIRLGEKQDAQDVLSGFFEEIRNSCSTAQAAKLHVFDFLHSVIRELAPEQEETPPTADGNNLWLELDKRDTLHLIRMYVFERVDSLLGSYSPDSAVRHKKIIEKVIRIIGDNCSRQISIEEIAGQVYMSPSYLRTIFKKVTGKTIFDVQTRVRLEKAEELLANNSLRIKDIASMLGYEYTSHFIAIFVKHKGITPAEYRSRLAVKN